MRFRRLLDAAFQAPPRAILPSLVLAPMAVAAVTAALVTGPHLANPTTAALLYLVVILITAAASSVWVAVAVSIAADLCLNYFFMAPVGTLTIADPRNWVALSVFLAVSVVASSLSTAVRDRAKEATARGDELARLFDLSRDVLLTTDSREAMNQLARFVSRRFDLPYAAICLPRPDGWEIVSGSALQLALDPDSLTRALADAGAVVEFDARSRTYSGHQAMDVDGRAVRLVPLRVGAHAVGLLASSGRAVEPGTLDALAGVVAIAIERVQLLDERHAAELARQGEALKSALLASLGHDLRTPLTAIRVAASNLQASWLGDGDRREQSDLILVEVERLNRLFQNILEMARLEAGGVTANLQWVHPAEIVEAALDQVAYTVRQHRVDVDSDSELLVRVDPRLTASALAHLVENAAQYSPPESPVVVHATASTAGLLIEVFDSGPGIDASDLARIFERFYRGRVARQRAAGTGMGLAIARGMLAAEGGRVWADNRPEGGAVFCIAVPAEQRTATPVVEAS
jgi:two-component system sensor histidine kinase KdpD